MNKNDFMREALRLAANNATHGTGGPFGAVVVRNGEIIAASANRVTSDNDPTAHAEVSAIRLACEKLNTFSLEDCEIYCSCQPCPMCLGAIYWARLGKIYYAATKEDAANAGFDDSFIYEQLDLKPEQRSIVAEQILETEKNIPFMEWVNNSNKIPY